MANTKAPLAPPPPSQVEDQSIAGKPPVAVRPGSTQVFPSSISAGASPYTYDQNKGKGNH